MSQGFPWAEVMRFGLVVLHLPPEQFWRATLKELAAARGVARTGGMARQALDAMMREFPDD